MTQTTHYQKLHGFLQQEIDTGEKLEQALVAEYEAIISNDLSALEHAIDAKQNCLERLEMLNQGKTILVESLGYAIDRAGIESCLNATDPSGSLPAMWQRLLDTATSCRQRNLLNHHLVDMASRHTYQALCVLRGEPPATNVYGSSGNTDDAHNSRSLAWV